MPREYQESTKRVPSSIQHIFLLKVLNGTWAMRFSIPKFHMRLFDGPWGLPTFRGLLFLWLTDPSFCPRNREISRVQRGSKMVQWCSYLTEIIHFHQPLVEFVCKVLRPILTSMFFQEWVEITLHRHHFSAKMDVSKFRPFPVYTCYQAYTRKFCQIFLEDNHKNLPKYHRIDTLNVP